MKMPEIKIYTAKEGYNKIAPYYDGWIWQQFWRENEYPFIVKWCNSLSPGVGLDIGTGSGQNLKCFLEKGHIINAIDISGKMLEKCEQKHNQYIIDQKLHCKELDIYNLKCFEAKYDWIISNRVFSNIKYIEDIIAKISNLLKYNGQCFISDIHPEHNYDYTNFSINGEDIYIETYKHSISLLKSLFDKYKLKVFSQKEITVGNLINHEILKSFPKLRNQFTPIFYCFILKK